MKSLILPPMIVRLSSRVIELAANFGAKDASRKVPRARRARGEPPRARRPHARRPHARRPRARPTRKSESKAANAVGGPQTEESTNRPRSDAVLLADHAVLFDDFFERFQRA